VDAYNDAVGSLETRVLSSARRFRALGTVDGQPEIEELQPIDVRPRLPAAPELTAD